MANEKDRLVRDQPVEMPAEQGPLAPYHGEQPPAPAMVHRRHRYALRDRLSPTAKAQRSSTSPGAISSKPGLLLVHGNGAHAHWWDFVAPYLTDDYHVVAMTFSGMGDPGWRDELHDGNVRAGTARRLRRRRPLFKHGEKPIIVAHSFGGFVTILTGANMATASPASSSSTRR